MLIKSLRNHLITTRKFGGLLLVVDAEKNRSFMVIKSIANEFVPAKQVGLEVDTIIGDVMGSRNNKSIQLSSINDPTRVADWVTGSPV